MLSTLNFSKNLKSCLKGICLLLVLYPYVLLGHVDSLSCSHDSSFAQIANDLKLVEDRIDNLELSKEYFNSLISIQTGIFSIIVVCVIAITWIYNHLRIKPEVEKRFKPYRNEIDKLGTNLENTLTERFSTNLSQVWPKLLYLQGEIYRSYSKFEELERNHNSALFFELKAAANFSASHEFDLYNACTKNAWNLVRKIKNSSDNAQKKEIWDLLKQLENEGNGVFIKLVKEHLEKLEKDS